MVSARPGAVEGRGKWACVASRGPEEGCNIRGCGCWHGGWQGRGGGVAGRGCSGVMFGSVCVYVCSLF